MSSELSREEIETLCRDTKAAMSNLWADPAVRVAMHDKIDKLEYMAEAWRAHKEADGTRPAFAERPIDRCPRCGHGQFAPTGDTVQVPREPTQVMCQAGQEKAREWPKFPLRISAIYRAMLSAAPAPAAQDDPEAVAEAESLRRDGERRDEAPGGVPLFWSHAKKEWLPAAPSTDAPVCGDASEPRK